jgi:hypothetical protein
MPCIPKLAAVLVLLAGCTQLDVFWRAATDEGTVYECKTASGDLVEICYKDDAADELGASFGGSCGEPSRRWPWFTNMVGMGCTYSCPPPRQGCNAEYGCYCP